MKGSGFSTWPLALALLVALLPTVTLAQTKKERAIEPAQRDDSEGWMARHEILNARVRRGDVNLLFLGDAVVQGWEDNGKEAWDEFYGKRGAVNLGIVGDLAEHVLWRLDHGNLGGMPPKLAVLMLGGDYPDGATPEDICAGTTAVVNKLRAKLPGAKVLVVGILPRGLSSSDPRRQAGARANELVAKLVDNKMVHYHDIGFAFLEPDQTLRKDLVPDHVHLSPLGYMALAEWLEDKVTTLTGEMENPVLPVPLSSLDWWFKKHESLNARVKQGNVDLIFIGDSITNGWDNEGRDVWATFYGRRNAVNLGISCDRTQNVLWRLDHGNIDGISPKLAIVMIGSNNSSRSKPEEIPEGIKAVVQRLRTKLPATKVLLLAIFPRGKDNQDPWRQINNAVNERIAGLADGKAVFYLDIGPRLVAPDGTASTEVLRDLAHLSAKGYEIWAEAMEPMVAKLMEEE
jgi:lysophospholipase L1-like esterase